MILLLLLWLLDNPKYNNNTNTNNTADSTSCKLQIIEKQKP